MESLADSGVDLDLQCIENFLIMIANTFRNKNPFDATLSPLGNSHNSRWRPRGFSSVEILKYKVCIVQNASFSDQISSINVTDVSYCKTVVIYLVVCECETKTASKMAA